MRHHRPANDEAYARALVTHTEHVLKLFVGERLINKIFARVLQSHAMGRLVIAHFDWKHGAGSRPTLTWLKQATGCDRTLAAFVSILKVARLISVESNTADRREKFLAPGPRVIAGLRSWLIHHLLLAESLQILPSGCAERLSTEETYFERLVRASIVVIDVSTERLSEFPRWQWFEDHECGARIAYLLLQAHYRECLRSASPVQMPHEIELTGASIAQSLGLSKSHVRNVINGAEKIGVLSHDERRRRMQLTAEFLHEVRRWFLHLLSLMATAHERALLLRVGAPNSDQP
jgi:hypothetical protein